MSVITSGKTFANGEQLSASKLKIASLANDILKIRNTISTVFTDHWLVFGR